MSSLRELLGKHEFLWTMGFRIPVKWKYVQQHSWCFLRYHLADQNFNWCLASLNWEYRAVSSKLHILQLQLSASKVRARSSSFSCIQTNSGVQQWIPIEWRFASPVWQDLWLDDWKSGSRPGFGIISHGERVLVLLRLSSVESRLHLLNSLKNLIGHLSGLVFWCLTGLVLETSL